ncbi:hypothetical protein ACHAW5_009310 [Stephanodiscus triporus]|uniref:UBC core domain-containing protein n=1 Tax=Stephanodiscus triporus TaxID=2934178 RepID=A0ABD3QK21_9STRA
MSHISPASKARLMREMSLLSKDPPPGVAAYAPEPSDMTKIRAQITGPEDSPFEGGIFLLSVHVTARYPFEPPRCRFLTPLYHPNVDSGGRICLDTLKSPPAGSWSPAVSLPSLLLSIRSLMAEPNPDDGLVPDISELYKRNPAEWQREARRRTRAEATVQKLEEVESSLDRESARNDAEDEIVAAGNEMKGADDAYSNSAESSQRGSNGARTSAEADNVQNGRESKKSKLSSRK